MSWPLDPDVLMWIQLATGFFGGLTLLYLLRALGASWAMFPKRSCIFLRREAARMPLSRS